jgi:hypothetical protein
MRIELRVERTLRGPAEAVFVGRAFAEILATVAGEVER